MEITHLRYFKKTAELEHITKAAQELHVAQPSLSRTISMLEDELKVKLFNRKGKSIELNEYGIIVLNHTNRILKELEAIHREIDDARENSVMNVTFSMNAASTLIPRLVRGFKEEHSDIRLHILQEDLVEDSGQSRELIRAGIGISFIPILTWQDMEDEHIALVPISPPHCRRYINLSWRESSYLSPAAILFRDYLIKHFAELVK